MQGVFSLTAGQVLTILVGQLGPQTGSYPGGGGGTFVALGSSYTTATPLIVAAGGAGVNPSGSGASTAIIGGQVSTTGIGAYIGAAGYGANAAPCCGGAGGFYTGGGADTYYSFPGAQGFRQGGAGAVTTCANCAGYDPGGFGGGGSGDYVGSCNTYGGPGGGYSGGSGNAGQLVYYGNGGGSYNGGTSQVNTASSHTGNGAVTITCVVVTASPTVIFDLFFHISDSSLVGTRLNNSSFLSLIIYGFSFNKYL